MRNLPKKILPGIILLILPFTATLAQTGRTALAYTTYSGLVEFTRAKIGALDDTARHIKVSILNIENDVSNVKIYMYVGISKKISLFSDTCSMLFFCLSSISRA